MMWKSLNHFYGHGRVQKLIILDIQDIKLENVILSWAGLNVEKYNGIIKVGFGGWLMIGKVVSINLEQKLMEKNK